MTYSKGAYVLQMLRSRRYADQSPKPEQPIIDLMHDFIESHRDKPASTESFKAVAEKHMTKQMDLQQNGRLDWFFNQWVYGTEVPRLEFNYQIQDGVLHIDLCPQLAQCIVSEELVGPISDSHSELVLTHYLGGTPGTVYRYFPSLPD